jgi:hypothetical protein
MTPDRNFPVFGRWNFLPSQRVGEGHLAFLVFLRCQHGGQEGNCGHPCRLFSKTLRAGGNCSAASEPDRWNPPKLVFVDEGLGFGKVSTRFTT